MSSYSFLQSRVRAAVHSRVGAAIHSRVGAAVTATVLAANCLVPHAVMATDAPAAGADEGALAEVVVTAQRRTERLQDVPISVSVYNQATMDAQGTRAIDDIARLTPGVTFVRGAVNNNSESSDIAIRGIDSTAGAATTGIYIDDTPIQSRHLSFGTFNAYPQLFDIDRVEVLRGPQGTLFGSGSEGGTIRFITPEPSLDRYSAYVRSEAAFTEHGDPVEEIGLAGGAPLIDGTLGVRASVSYRHEGGYVDRVDWHTDDVVDPDANANTTKTARLALKWAPNDSLAITPSVYYQKRFVDDTSSWWSTVPGPDDPTGGEFDRPFRSGNEVASPSADEFTLSAVKIDWDIGPVRLVSNTSYYKRQQSATSDYTQYDRAVFLGSPFAAEGVQAPTAWADDQQNWTQEVRLESADKGSRVTWTAGVFYQHAKENTIENVYDPALLEQIGVPVGDGYIYQQDPFDSLDKQIALFGQADIKITDPLKATLGVRVAKADFTGQAYYTGFVVGPPVSSVGTQTEHPVTPKFGLDYQIDAEDLLYVSVAKGFRIGGANPAIGQFCDLTPYGLKGVPPGFAADDVWSYEIGTKNTFDERRVLLNASLYLIRWNNIQQNVALPCGFQFTANLGQAESKGLDLQAEYRLSEAFTLGGTFGYTDAAYTETVFATPAAAETPGSYSIVQDGDHLAGAPWTLAVFGEGHRPIYGIDGYARLDYQYSAKQTSLIAAQNPLNGGSAAAVPGIPSTSYATLRVGGKWSGLDASLFAQNLFDTRPRLSSTEDGPNGTPLFQVISWRPRTVGVTVLYHY
jgi:outer membrane receptor protein involved in Fe transport